MGEIKYGKVDITASSSLGADATVFRPAKAFLDIAAKLAVSSERMDWNLCVVCSAVACEIATEKTIVGAGKHKKEEEYVKQHRKPSRDKELTYKMNAPQTQGVYQKLTDDDITKPDCEWTQYLRLVDHRNQVLHQAIQKTKSEAEECLDIGRRLVERLNHVQQRVLAKERPA